MYLYVLFILLIRFIQFNLVGLRLVGCGVPWRSYASIEGVPISIEASDLADEALSVSSNLDSPEDPSQDTVAHLLTHTDDVARLMKMERSDGGSSVHQQSGKWFPYLDRFKCGSSYLGSGELMEALGPHILDSRKERFRNVVKNRSYSVCLVVEGLSDFGNVSAAFRSADALGFQSVHVVSCDSSKRCNGV